MGTVSDCQAECPNYIHSVLYHRTMETKDLHTLTVMVALTAAMTSLVMVAVFILVIFKIRKRKRVRKKVMPTSVYTVEKGKVDIEGNAVKDNTNDKSNKYSADKKRESLETGPSDNSNNTINTMVTQLSQESSINIPSMETNTTGITRSTNISKRFGKLPRRLPSEDCVPE